ncbi:hypothetical protein NK8_82410 (plasmid) [Caballeronia sp. NK8]|nr:hypothetical protein NK8_82410 [Caballeronia sp. NK8]
MWLHLRWLHRGRSSSIKSHNTLRAPSDLERLWRLAPVSVEWDTLAIAAFAGDQEQYELLLAYIACCLEHCFPHFLSPSMVEAAVNETLTAIHRKRHTYHPSDPFERWAIAIARYRLSSIHERYLVLDEVSSAQSESLFDA